MKVELLQSVSESAEILETWNCKKTKNTWLFNNMARIDDMRRRAERVLDCGSWLEFAHDIDSRGVVADEGKLHRANFCRDRLCPMCNWRRSKKIYGQVQQIMENMPEKLRYIFLTLTIRNVPGSDLSYAMDRMQDAFKHMFHKRDGALAPFSLGYIRSMEVTYNKQADTFHPHFHVIIAVQPSYFKGLNYKKQAWYQTAWNDALRFVGYDVASDEFIVNIKACKPGADGKYTGAVAEIAKYAAKDTDYLKEALSVEGLEVMRTFAEALKGRRLFSMGGLFKEIWKQLRLDDAEEGDLVVTDQDQSVHSEIIMLLIYRWGGKMYKLSSARIESSQAKERGVLCGSG